MTREKTHPPVIPKSGSLENDFNYDNIYSNIKNRQCRDQFSSPIIKRKKLENDAATKKNTNVNVKFVCKPKVKKCENVKKTRNESWKEEWFRNVYV